LSLDRKKKVNPTVNLIPSKLMRDFVINIGKYAKNNKTNFIIIPQNGIELISTNGIPDEAYLNTADGNGQEDLFYGYDNDNQLTSLATIKYLKKFITVSHKSGKTILVTDYYSTEFNILASYAKNNYISYSANQRTLATITSFPNPIKNVNSSDITTIGQAKNFLYLINPEKFLTKNDFISAVTATNYDLSIMDFFFNENIEFTAAEIIETQT
jgi:cysteinyl-tRNA synthetase